MPVVVNYDFGHINPKFIFPIGGEAEIRGKNIIIVKH